MGAVVSSRSAHLLSEEERYAVLEGDLTLKGIARRITNGRSKSIIVMAGAGISVAAGIPDFRSPNTGLYSQLGDLGLPCPEAVFSILYFNYNPKPFFQLARRLFPGSYSPTAAHYFLALLQKKGLLRRVYTQNVDNLERLAGLPSAYVVEAHGSFADAHCTRCGRQYPLASLRQHIEAGAVPRCPGEPRGCWAVSSCCTRKSQEGAEAHVSSHSAGIPQIGNELGEEATDAVSKVHQGESPSDPPGECAPSSPKAIQGISPDGVRQRSVSPKKNSLCVGKRKGFCSTCNGVIKPDITFFGESLPHRFKTHFPVDLPQADLLIILGTSLQVYPFAGLVDLVDPLCPRLLINKEAVGLATKGDDAGLRFFLEDNYRDVFARGECDGIVRKLCTLLGWTQELEDLIAFGNQHCHGNYWKLLETLQVLDASAVIPPKCNTNAQ